ncbi:MAG TPA: hypothetical protein VFQ61_16805 [Polyangiaceae bacterium]|nr:hypothetical protein [Polyangiaceae bacterium]
MVRRTRTTILVFVTGVAVTTAAGAQYVYTRGLNYVDTAGSRCVVGAANRQADVGHYTDGVAVSSSVSTSRTVYCPINRRSLNYYEQGSDTVNAKSVTVNNVNFRVYDASSTQSLSCKLFFKGVGGSVSYSATRYACSSFLGCSTDPGSSFTGMNVMAVSGQIINTNTVEWGLMCSLPSSSQIYAYEAFIKPNAN